jgi:hypothetical protein
MAIGATIIRKLELAKFLRGCCTNFYTLNPDKCHFPLFGAAVRYQILSEKQNGLKEIHCRPKSAYGDRAMNRIQVYEWMSEV